MGVLISQIGGAAPPPLHFSVCSCLLGAILLNQLCLLRVGGTYCKCRDVKPYRITYVYRGLQGLTASGESQHVLQHHAPGGVPQGVLAAQFSPKSPLPVRAIITRLCLIAPGVFYIFMYFCIFFTCFHTSFCIFCTVLLFIFDIE